MLKTQSQWLADPAWARLDRAEDRLMAALAAEMTDPGSTGCDDRDFGDELREIAAEKAALEVPHG